MILITGICEGSTTAVRDIFLTLGIISEICPPCEVGNLLSPRHNALIAVGKNFRVGACEITSKIRQCRPEIPIFALREDIFSEDAACFDAVYPNSLCCAVAHRRLVEIARERKIRAVGEYGAEGISVTAVRRVFCGEAQIPMTRAEASVLSTVLAFYPDGVSAERIASLSFRTGREPSPSGVRTHISAINKKLSTVTGVSVIGSGDGYTLGRKLAFAF